MSKALLEAALFMTDEPISVKKLAAVTGMRSDKIRKLLKEIEARYKEDSGIFLEQFQDGYKFSVRKEFLPHVAPLTPHADLSRALLRTLAIVAYKQPVTQSDIVKVIGNRAYEYIKALENKGLISGEKFVRTKRLRTTKQFDEYFGVDLKEAKEQMEGIVRSGKDEGAVDVTGADAGSQRAEKGAPGSKG